MVKNARYRTVDLGWWRGLVGNEVIGNSIMAESLSATLFTSLAALPALLGLG